ncbi:MAG: hypothetical protein Kow00109_29410 [Acidobacteriota bacterium]
MRWVALVGWLGAAVAAGQALGPLPPERFCVTEAGRVVERRYLLLEEEQFTEAELTRIFAPYVEEPGVEELLVAASSDPEFFRGKWLPPREEAVFFTTAPVAYFFRIGPNAFFQYGRPGGEVHWVVLAGENPFHRRFGKTELRWAGTSMAILFGEQRCSRGSYWLLFIGPKVWEEDLEAIARYYCRLFAHWGRFAFQIFPREELAYQGGTSSFPSIEVMPWYERGRQGLTVAGPDTEYVNYTFVRGFPPTWGYFLRYDRWGERASWEKRVELGPEP